MGSNQGGMTAGSSRNLTTSGDSWTPVIHSISPPINDVAAWIEVLPNGNGQVVANLVNSGTPVQTTVIGGPVPSASQVNVGDRFIVWDQFVSGQYDLAAYDTQLGQSFTIANNSTVNEQAASSEGNYIAFEVASTTTTGIELFDADATDDMGVFSTVANNGANNLRPNISGDWISYESDVLGNSQIFVYNIMLGETFQVTNNDFNEHLNDLYCYDPTSCLVTYVDNRNGNDGVFDTSFTLIPSEAATPLPAALPLFATGLGGLGLLGWRRKRKAQAAVA